MFSVGRFDPKKEDARKSVGDKRKKRSKGRSTDRSSDARKKTKKRKRDSKNRDGEDSVYQHKYVGESSPAQIRTKTSATETAEEVAEKARKENKNSTNNVPKDDHTVTKLESMTEAAFRVIAPETDGALSSKKNLNGKISTEAFDDLDLTDDAWLSSLSSKKKNAPKKRIKEDDDDENNKSQPPSLAFDPTDEIERALEMTRLPILEAARRWGMANFLVQNLQANGHERFFPIQALVIPDVIVAERHMTSLCVRDVCCAAPTGSGKTLAFVLPVLNALATRRIRRLRALVILPSRDLAQQVYRVFDDYRKGSENDLRIGLAIGQTDFKAEQKKLILGDDDDGGGKVALENRNWPHLRYSMDPGNLSLALDVMGKELQECVDNDACGGKGEWKKKTNKIPAGGISAVDVLVCTPGRLVDHLDNTPGFTLQHLRWLIIDEADRLLSQSYHGWIQRVLDSVHAPPRPTKHATYKNTINEDNDFTIDPVTYRRSEQDKFVTAVSLSAASSNDDISSCGIGAYTDICQRIQLRKLLYSATLTKDPQKLSSLRLVNPKYFNAHDLKQRQNALSSNKSSDHNINNISSLYRMPEQLKEQTVECTAEQKPLVLLALLLEKLNDYRYLKESSGKKSTIVVFASSLESTHRLTRLLQLLWQTADFSGAPPVEFSSALNQHKRSLLMKRCNDPNDRSVSVLVASDGMSRGMDLASCRFVIHYDVPGMAKTYVHRCGRTARAGEDGTAIALLKGKGQAGQFFRLRRLIALPERVTKASVKTSLVREVIPLYKHCVSRLREVLAAEDRNELKPTDPDLTRWLPDNDGGEDSSKINSSSDSEMSLE